MALLTPSPKFHALDSNGSPLSGGKLYAYVAGTTTPLDTYTDQGGGTPNANPVILDSRGEANVWLSTTSSYKLILKTSADVTIWTVDNISATGLASDVQNSVYTLIGSVAGTNTITGSVSPTPSAYANGQAFILKPAATNTGATTINLNSLGAKSIFAGGAACVGGELVSGVSVVIVYDGTQFNILEGGPVRDTRPVVVGGTDATKKVRLEVDGLTTGTTRVLTVQDSDHTLVGRDTTDTLTNKTVSGAATGSTVAMGTGSGTGTHVVVANINTTVVGNVGGGTDDLMTYSLPANSLSANGKAIRVTGFGTSANNANAKTLGFQFGVTASTMTLTTSVAGHWFVTATITRTGSNAQRLTWHCNDSVSTGTTSTKTASSSTTTAETDSGAITIKFTGLSGGSATDDITQVFMLVEYLN